MHQCLPAGCSKELQGYLSVTLSNNLLLTNSSRICCMVILLMLFAGPTRIQRSMV
ncbi:hypothetical protein EJB05_35319 [Eragrostis curvula]|uniref:Uncharacterized protein n=1 Tax=Eragrostis curvula TaxID=38414 RepID=A0A5J9U652_9POAL|nr:hypothetical protein EJB05_35319 [Eragrostis curvula]